MSPNDPVRDVVLARSGDLHAFERLLREIEPALRGYLRRIAAASADDVLQESYIRIWRGLPWLREPALFRAWAYRIATREAQRSMGREQRRNEVSVEIIDVDKLPAPFADASARLDAERLLGQISPLARIVLAAHYYEGLSLAEVSAVTGAPLGTVKSRLASGLSQLRALMEASR